MENIILGCFRVEHLFIYYVKIAAGFRHCTDTISQELQCNKAIIRMSLVELQIVLGYYLGPVNVLI